MSKKADIQEDSDISNSRIGVRIRHLRQLRGLGLRTLAAQAGCSPSFLSRVENGVVNPSLTTLHNLVGVLETNISELFAETADDAEWVARAGRRPVIRTDSLRQRSGVELERLAPYTKGNLLQATVHIVAPGGGSDGAIRHVGQEVGYVLEGRLELTVDGETCVLETGDSFFFESQRRHGYRNPGPEVARVLWVNTPPTF
jgi:transcriptional regulator with XRE-family HTH domain